VFGGQARAHEEMAKVVRLSGRASGNDEPEDGHQHQKSKAASIVPHWSAWHLSSNTQYRAGQDTCRAVDSGSCPILACLTMICTADPLNRCQTVGGVTANQRRIGSELMRNRVGSTTDGVIRVTRNQIGGKAPWKGVSADEHLAYASEIEWARRNPTLTNQRRSDGSTRSRTSTMGDVPR
jgi:hypothetical protein